MKIESGSTSQRHGSADPDTDPHQNVMDRKHCSLQLLRFFLFFLVQFSVKDIPVKKPVFSRSLNYVNLLLLKLRFLLNLKIANCRRFQYEYATFVEQLMKILCE
jgi:hypothetical protein